MDTCEFSYISLKTNLQTTARGIERSWDNLKMEFNRTGAGIPGAIYYKTISAKGPELFAVLDDKCVFYHDKGEWHRYITATNVKIGQMNTTDDPQRGATEETNQLDSENISTEEQYSLENDDD